MDEGAYGKALVNLDSQLSDKNIKDMVFLASEKIVARRPNHITDGMGFFDALKSCGSLSTKKLSYLRQLLETVDRRDLLDSLEHGEANCEMEDEIDPFRKLLYGMSQKIGPDDLYRMRNLRGVPKNEKVDDAVDLFKYMIRKNQLKPKFLDPLKETLNDITRVDLVELIDEYNKGSSASASGSHVSQETGKGDSEKVKKDGSSECYKMDAVPVAFGHVITSIRHKMAKKQDKSSLLPKHIVKQEQARDGLCLIIDVQNFPNRPDDYRKGSEFDREALKTTFSKLKFKVKELCDKTAAEIKSELKDVSEMDHSAYDCIVICILSHGIKDYFRGSDWKLVAEKDIFPLFSARNCPTLAKKPKLLFLTYCRYKYESEGVTVDGDPVHDYSDFVFGYSTLEEDASYRKEDEGTVYIQALTKVLNEEAPKKTELQHILVKVNEEVSKKAGGRQIPKPEHTLTRQLYFL